MNKSSIEFNDFEPYGLSIPITNLDLEKYFYKRDADNIAAIRNYLGKNDMQAYGIFWTARDILFNKKNFSTIDLMVIDSERKIKNYVYGNNSTIEYSGPSLSYIRKGKFFTYPVFFDINNTHRGEELIADLFIKASSPVNMRICNTIELRFINEECVKNNNKSDLGFDNEN